MLYGERYQSMYLDLKKKDKEATEEMITGIVDGEIDQEMEILGNNLDNAKKQLHKQIQHPGCLLLIDRFIETHGMHFAEAVASTRHHHNHIGGLLEHTMEVVNLSNTIQGAFKNINLDLLLTGAFLHDIGKTYAYTEAPLLKSGKVAKNPYEVSREGQVMGHFGDALVMITEFLHELKEEYGEPVLNYAEEDMLYHMIASHHGDCKYWGSMVEPNTNEAYILSSADLMSSRIKEE